MTPGPFRRSLRRSRRGTEPQDVWASVDGMPGVVLTVPSPEMFVMIDGLAVRATPQTPQPGTLLPGPGDTVQIRYDAGAGVDADPAADPADPASARLVAA
ncbi:hypothetical protein [Catenulispora rubra]|uniref:hypothetical protein n=1 Tax=Catenulispora rubra TaxID=280293 RepID=UPI0018926307|nr:hypothetical protein [Catenulispora rubra]